MELSSLIFNLYTLKFSFIFYILIIYITSWYQKLYLKITWHLLLLFSIVMCQMMKSLWESNIDQNIDKLKFVKLSSRLIRTILRCLQTPWEIGSHLRERWHPEIRVGSSGLHPSSQSGSPRVGKGHVSGWSSRSNESAQQRRRREPQKSSVHHLQCNWNLAFFLCDSRVV